jgi:peptidoglycan/LPS O-acetylase OafA/YrhL
LTEAKPPQGRETAVARVIVGVLALALAAGAFAITSELALGWRVLLAVLVAAPLLLLVDLLRSTSGPPPGFKPRKRNDEETGCGDR